jgi:DNA polymerase I
VLENEVIIMSADQDFLQLVNDRIVVWSPNKKKYYTKEQIFTEYGIPAHNFLMYKCLMGDKSDNLEGIKGLGPKKIRKVIPEITGKRVKSRLSSTLCIHSRYLNASANCRT